MLRFIICEDNKKEMEMASLMVNQSMVPYDFEYRISKFSLYTKELKELIDSKEDQKVYILDVELGKVSGLEIASKIREHDWDSFIIFTTISREAKNDIFYSRLLAIDFILKNSFYEKRLKETLDGVINIVNSKRVLIYSYKNCIYRLPYDSINYVEKVPIIRKCIIVTDNNTQFEYPGSIIDIKKKVGPNFFQSHQSGLVNVNNILAVDLANCIIKFKNGSSTNLLSHSHRKELKEIVGDY